jgi:cell division protein YceG involved in septum cleavage
VTAGSFPIRWRGLFLSMLLLMVASVALSSDGRAGMQRVTFAIHPGERVSDLADRWQRMGISSRSAVEAVAGSKDYARFPLVPPPRPEMSRFEGLFRPGSYTIMLPEQSAGEVTGRYRYRITVLLISSLLAKSAPVYEKVLPGHGLNVYQLLILASIVQKEAAAGTDYRLVASVFFNRIARNMELGSCPTLEYALGYHRPFLTFADLKTTSPYNTYRHKGLPPTPIAFFSRKALAAVQHPARSGYLFFVFDWTTDRLFFARSYREHQKQARVAKRNYIHKYDLAALYRKHPGIFYQ